MNNQRINNPITENRLKELFTYNPNTGEFIIDGGYFYRCCTAPFIPSVLLGLEKEHDGIALEGLTEAGLADYLATRKVPASCYVCASNMGNRIEWRETSRENWMNESVR